MVESSPKYIEKTVGKGEIARYEQFLLFPQCFQKSFTAHVKNQGFFGAGLKVSSPFSDIFVKIFPIKFCLGKSF